MAVERKYERDIDILLAEEFAVSSDFAGWFLRQTRFANLNARVLHVQVSPSDNTGESDVVVIFEESEGNNRFALMIEDKIDAPLQPEQEARYRLRGQVAVSRGEYNDFEVILCAPKAYRTAQPKAASFDSFVSYEAIGRFLREHDPSTRGEYRANFIETAASRRINTWTRIDDKITNEFWKSAYNVAIQEFPILERRELNLTKDSTWITFRPRDMPTKPQWVYVNCKGDKGYMDLTFTGSRADRFQPLVESFLPADMTVHQTGKSASIRITVEGFRVSDPWETGETKIRAAFAACERLIKFYREHRHVLNSAAAKSLPDPSEL